MAHIMFCSVAVDARVGDRDVWIIRIAMDSDYVHRCPLHDEREGRGERGASAQAGWAEGGGAGGV